MAEPEAPGARGPGPAIDWTMILRVVGVAAGSAAWVQLVGSLDMWARFQKVGVAHTSTVALLPKDLLFATGVRALALPVAVAVGAFGVLLLCQGMQERKALRAGRPLESVERNPAGARPPGFGPVLVVLVLLAVYVTFWSALAVGAKLALTALSLVFAGTCYLIVVCTKGFANAAAALLGAAALFGGLFGIAVQYFAPAKLDIAVALRTDGTVVDGFYIGRTGDSLYVLTTAGSGREPNTVVTGEAPAAQPSVPPKQCRTKEIVGSGSIDCYVEQVVGIPNDDVVKFAIGPRGIPVTRNGYQAARVLAQTLARDEAARKPTTTTTPGAGG